MMKKHLVIALKKEVRVIIFGDSYNVKYDLLGEFDHSFEANALARKLVPYRVECRGYRKKKQIESWLRKNCEGYFYYPDSCYAQFENKEDAVNFFGEWYLEKL